MSVDRGGIDHGRQLMNLHNNEAGRRVSFQWFSKLGEFMEKGYLEKRRILSQLSKK